MNRYIKILILLVCLIVSLQLVGAQNDAYLFISYTGEYNPYIDEVRVVESNPFYDDALYENQITFDFDIELIDSRGKLIDKLFSVPAFYLTLPYDESVAKVRLLDGDLELSEVEVSFCNNNRICEPCLEEACVGGESSASCGDCKNGANDGFCDMRKDGICDPDCEDLDGDCEECSDLSSGCWYNDPVYDYDYCINELQGLVCAEDEICAGDQYPQDDFTSCCSGECVLDEELLEGVFFRNTCAEIGGIACEGENTCDGLMVESSDSLDCCIEGECIPTVLSLSWEDQQKPQNFTDLIDKTFREEKVVRGDLIRKTKPIFFIVPIVIGILVIIILVILLLGKKPPKKQTASKKATYILVLVFIISLFSISYIFSDSLTNRITGFATDADPPPPTTTPPTTTAGPTCSFDPNKPNWGMVISDDDWTDTSFTQAQIETFLEKHSGRGLKNEFGVKPFAKAVYDASQKYKVSPIVMLTILQKEQSLIRKSSLTERQKKYAAGCDCPIKGCRERSAGINKQMECMGKTMRGRFEDGLKLNFPMKIRKMGLCHDQTHRPDIFNAATYAIYKYTPYTCGPSYKKKKIYGGGSYMFNKIFLDFYNKFTGQNPKCTNTVCEPIKIKNDPRMSIEQIKKELEDAASPAKDQAEYIHKKGKEKGIDPAVLMAFFKRESKYGTDEPSKNTLAIKNIECSTGCKDQYNTADKKCYCKYSDWQASIDAWYELISGPNYLGSGLDSVEAIAPVYEPSNKLNADELSSFTRTFISKFTQLPPCKSVGFSGMQALQPQFITVEVGHYHIMPSFSIEVDYNVDFYNVIKSRAKELIRECKPSQTNELRDCINKKIAEFHSKYPDIVWGITGAKDKLSIKNQGAERFFYQFFQNYKLCLDSADTDCICRFDLEEGNNLGFDDNSFKVLINPAGTRKTVLRLVEPEPAEGEEEIMQVLNGSAAYVINSANLNRDFREEFTYNIEYDDGIVDDAELEHGGEKLEEADDKKLNLYHFERFKLAYIDDSDLEKTKPSGEKYSSRECQLKDYRIFNFDLNQISTGRTVKFALTFPPPPPPMVENVKVIDTLKAEHSVIITWDETLPDAKGFAVYYNPDSFIDKEAASFRIPEDDQLLELLPENIYHDISSDEVVDGRMQYKFCRTEEEFIADTCTKGFVLPSSLYKITKTDPDGYMFFASGVPFDGDLYYFGVTQTDSKDIESDVSEPIEGTSIDDVAPAKIKKTELRFDEKTGKYTILFELPLSPAPDIRPLGENGEPMEDNKITFIMYGMKLPPPPAVPPSFEDIVKTTPLVKKEISTELVPGQTTYFFTPIFNMPKEDHAVVIVAGDEANNPDLTKPENKDLAYETTLEYDTTAPAHFELK